MSLITVKGLVLGYEHQVVAEGINFTVEEGDYLCIVGENGSGKTTLMKTLLGLRPSLGGEIVMGEGLRAGDIGYLPQQTVVQKDFPASVREIVLSGCQARNGLRPFYGKEERKLAEDNMAKLEISGLADRCYRDLSGGQQQRVLLARALCAAKRILLLDEPVSGLDPFVTADLYETIYSLNEDGMAIIMVSHDVSAAIKYSRHILHIGDTVFYGTTAAYLESEPGLDFLYSKRRARSDV